MVIVVINNLFILTVIYLYVHIVLTGTLHNVYIYIHTHAIVNICLYVYMLCLVFRWLFKQRVFSMVATCSRYRTPPFEVGSSGNSYLEDHGT